VLTTKNKGKTQYTLQTRTRNGQNCPS